MLFAVLLKSALCFHGDISVTATSLVCCCVSKYICIPNAANMPTLVSNPVSIYFFSSDYDEIFIMRTDSGVGGEAAHRSLGHLLPMWVTSCMCQLA